jgi:hypothetical protein
MSRDGSDADHRAMTNVIALLPDDPHVGETLRVWTDDGKLIRTTTVRRVTRSGSQIVVDTTNSRYRLQLLS